MTGFRLRYLPQLDGMRAVAIVAVMAFHASVLHGAQGGYFGVEVFFVLSGFLITSLLAQERSDTGKISLPAFYARRALRLLPALVAMLAAVTVYALLRPDAPETTGFTTDLLATLAYVANWAGAFSNHFDTHLLNHAWTLGVEEQFYLLWPFVLVLVLQRRGGRRLALVVAASGFVLSTAWRIRLYYSDTPLPRVLLGLDTRVGALLLGAAIGIAATAGWLDVPARVARVAGVAGIAWLAYMFFGTRYGLVGIVFNPSRVYVEGILLADIASALLLIGVVFDGRGPLTRLLATSPMVWVGQLSYSLYLWHAPIDVILTRERLGGSAFETQAARLVVTVAVAVASYYLIELRFLRLKNRFGRQPVNAAESDERSDRANHDVPAHAASMMTNGSTGAR